MTFFVLASVRAPANPASRPRRREFWLESLDGQTIVPLTQVGGLGWDLLAGSSGLEVNPVDVDVQAAPGVPGAAVADTIYPPRPVLLSLGLGANTWAAHDAAVQALRDVTDPARNTRDGGFRLACATDGSVRRLGLTYLAGLEGDGSETLTDRDVVLSCVAPQPFAEDRDVVSREFALTDAVSSFLGGTWGEIGLSASQLLSTGGPVELFSAVPVWPDVTIQGPVSSVHITSDTGMDVEVTSAIAAGEALTIVTDPRRRSIRLDGAAAAGMLARGSRLVPFGQGQTILTVNAPGATSEAVLRLSWRGMHRSLW